MQKKNKTFLFTVGNLQNIFMEHDLYLISVDVHKTEESCGNLV